MQKLFVSQQLYEVDSLKEVLEQAGILCRIKNLGWRASGWRARSCNHTSTARQRRLEARGTRRGARRQAQGKSKKEKGKVVLTIVGTPG